MQVGRVVANRLNCTLGKVIYTGRVWARIGLREGASLGPQFKARLVYQIGLPFFFFVAHKTTRSTKRGVGSDI